MAYRVGMDVGGTFTDFVVSDGWRVILTWKEESTPEDSMRAVLLGLEAIAGHLGLRLEDFLGQTSLLVHGTTTAMNTVIQRVGPRVGLVCTEGFRDVLYFRNGFKPDRFNIQLQHPRALVDRWLRVGVRERIGAGGEVVTPLDEDSVRRAAADLRAARVEAVAVALLWAPVNRSHERRTAELLREELPGVPVIEAVEVLPEIREWERASAAVLSAYILPEIDRYLQRFQERLRGSGLRRSPLIMQTNGGCASVEEILARPVYSLASGPAAAAAAALHVAETPDLITMDLGGTSFDVSLITDRTPALSRTMEIEGQPIGVTGVAVHSIGAGGGSIASVDAGGAIQVGPQSAGARPGPACYGMGGTRATVTDAYVALGYLDPDAFLGGRIPLREDLAREAIERDVARPLGLDLVYAAAGVKRVVDARMVRAIQAISVRRGIDPRRFVLVAGGGAGGLHASRLARELGVRHVIVPGQAAVFCALGMTVTDVRHDYARLMRTTAHEADLGRLAAMFAEMEEDGRRRLRAEGFDDADVAVERSVDARYRGQIYELTVPLSGAPTLEWEDLARAADAFHARHQALFGYHRTDLPVDYLHWRLVTRGRVAEAASPPPGDLPAGSRARPEPVGQRLVHYLDFGGWILTDIHLSGRLRPGDEVEGPAVIRAPATTLLLAPGDHVRVRADGSYLLAVAREKDAYVPSLEEAPPEEA
jgi:N-methylhydantoinase A